MESEEHKNLVNELLTAFINIGYTIENADLKNYKTPPKIGRHEPDIIANNNGLIIIGEAKTKEDINSENSKEQFVDFSNRVMASGPLKGRAIPLHIIIKKEDVQNLRSILHSLGLENKIGNIITIWSL